MARKPSYSALQHERKLEREERQAEAGLVSERFSRVERIVIRMTYQQGGDRPDLMERTVNFFPSSFAYFRMRCFNPGCEDGSFDLGPAVAGLVRRRGAEATGTMKCNSCSNMTPEERASISFSIAAEYKK